MPELTFIDWNTEDILKEIAIRYKMESSEELEIGSHEMAIAAAVTYILMVAKNRFNEMAKQRFLDTATGAYLDAHAQNLIGEVRPKNVRARVLVSFSTAKDSMPYIAYDIFRISHNGVVFRSVQQGPAAQGGFIFECIDEDVVKGNSVSNGTEFEILTPLEGILSATAVSSSSGGIVEPYPYTDDGDNAFREYIKQRRKGISVAGPADAYKNMIMDIDKNILDVYILRDTDAEFVPGHITAYVLLHQNYSANHDALFEAIKRELENSDKRPLNDIIDLPRLQVMDFASGAITVTFRYKKTQYVKDDIESKVQGELDLYAEYLRSGFGRSFSESALCKRILTKYDGVIDVSSGVDYDPIPNMYTVKYWNFAAVGIGV